MLFELIIVACFLFGIAVVFYKLRRASSLELLQLEFSERAEKLQDLAAECQPLILRGVPIPPSLTAAQFRQFTKLDAHPLRTAGAAAEPLTLGAYRSNPAATLPVFQEAGVPITSPEAGLLIAQELSLDAWVTHTFQEFRLELFGAFDIAYTTQVHALFGGAGLTKSISSMTCLLPVEGTYTVSVLSPATETFLPKVWRNRYPDTITIQDTPLVGELKYIDIKVRPGTMVCLPAHTIYSLQPDNYRTFHTALRFDYDTPVSNIVKLLGNL